ncbi:putative nucleotide-sugar transporter [Aspergillus fischeri NRRL 181]|uniref:Nucleotide-sugar transporter, putative n=1 Tax=Neosartorya fischeri (strain ATCC 1020 / DSM 3700 / CBS 544.65 / FGSC A1164 / JCM 1740 / NRRL 181 / WB 181) TaxID=331117 RepID=A1DAR5_NEOFI|nr:nucleotide-sugar transporter, putative [Aspergillus fischeri NRRL 181]EAW19955.1 nucleotide-sugar transporter, putative [Aspergillus fischeri NRRL 181]
MTIYRFSLTGHTKVQVSTLAALLLLVLQNAASIILQHKIQSQSTIEDKHFDPLTGILLSELLKLTISLLCIAQTAEEPKSLLTTLKTNHDEATLPALLYTAASLAQSIGASSLDLLPYLALSQTKLILTPLLATLLLNQRLTLQHWTSTLTMTAGIILAQTGANASAENQHHRTTANSNVHPHPLPGILAMLLSGSCVALGSLSIERSLKRAANSTTTTTANAFFIRNAQLAAHSLLFALLSFLWKEKCRIDGSSFFEGFNSLVWVFVVLQASGGFLVAWCVRVTSSVTKNYAQGMGFAIAVVGPLAVESKDVDGKLLVGVVLVLGAVVGSAFAGQSMRVTNVTEMREVKGVV